MPSRHTARAERRRTFPAGIKISWLVLALAVFLTGLVSSLTDLKAQEISGMPVQPTVDLPVGQGRLLRFNEPVESVLIADTTIADLQVVSPGVVYVFGLKPGLTNLIAITSDERIKATAQFRVTADISSATAS